ncbi:GDP-mannose:cellobiosyl-diphosphopolyprenol alpha-mannosyltransferase [Brucella sp. NBRC 12952]|uniref:Glycosyltransferase n=1 Tax=Brucella pseudogrignonensis TaxID=419475 RepID=A0A7Y3WZ82_9HYPH|nr:MULTISPECIES: glycosyltransferase [Brucella]NNV22979.1 glycosyltransferase [Brucella pseudogrignonensis]
MKIIHIIGSFDPAKGGPQAVVVRLAAAQAALGHDVTIVSYSDDEIDYRAAKATAAIPGFQNVKTFMLPMPDRYEVLTGRRAAKVLSAMIASANFVHMHGVWETILLRASMLCRKYHVAYCICCCGMLDVWSMQQKRWKKRLAFNLAFRRMLNGAAFIQALNQDEADLMRPLRLRPPVVIIGNGIFLEEIETSEGKPAALPDRPYILFLSRLHYKKGLDILADAFCQIADRYPQIDLVVAGPDGGAQPAFLTAIGQAGLQARVHLTGALYGPTKIAALRNALCFCLPSRQEGFSVAITEALACGVPVVITDACHFPEVAEANAGIVCQLSAQAVAIGLTTVLENPERAAEMGQAGLKLVRDNYTWPQIAAQTINAYQRFEKERTGSQRSLQGGGAYIASKPTAL